AGAAPGAPAEDQADDGAAGDQPRAQGGRLELAQPGRAQAPEQRQRQRRCQGEQAHATWARNGSSSAKKASGRSSIIMWPACGRMATRELGILPRSSDNLGGVIRSSAPPRIRVGVLIWRPLPSKRSTARK